MAGLTFTLFVVAMLVVQAAVFVALVMVGVRLAIGAPLFPERREWLRRIKLAVHTLRSTVARARHYSGTGL